MSCESFSNRPIKLDFPSSTDPQVMKRRRSFVMLLFRLAQHEMASEVALTLLFLHRRGLVAVNQAALSLRYPRGSHLRDNVLQRIGAGLDGARQGIATERPKPDDPHLGLFAGLQRQTPVVNHDPSPA